VAHTETSGRGERNHALPMHPCRNNETKTA
jgi:hypothetical protein